VTSRVDVPQRTVGSDVAASLDAAAAELRELWSSALARGDFDEVTRLADASHAVHRALIALTTDRFVAARSSSPSA
jgi:hypothetical protein